MCFELPFTAQEQILDIIIECNQRQAKQANKQTDKMRCLFLNLDLSTDQSSEFQNLISSCMLDTSSYDTTSTYTHQIQSGFYYS